jgi:hypothetical protein
VWWVQFVCTQHTFFGGHWGSGVVMRCYGWCMGYRRAAWRNALGITALPSIWLTPYRRQYTLSYVLVRATPLWYRRAAQANGVASKSSRSRTGVAGTHPRCLRYTPKSGLLRSGIVELRRATRLRVNHPGRRTASPHTVQAVLHTPLIAPGSALVSSSCASQRGRI